MTDVKTLAFKVSFLEKELLRKEDKWLLCEIQGKRLNQMENFHSFEEFYQRFLRKICTKKK